jgi:cytochrome P450/glutathione S-transferase
MAPLHFPSFTESLGLAGRNHGLARTERTLVPEDYDPPRYVIVAARVSPMVELARWLFERHRIPYEEQAHAPLLHVFFTRRHRGGNEVPVVVTSASVWKGAREMLVGLDGRLREGERLFGETDSERKANQALADQLLQRLQANVRRVAYFHLLPLKRVCYPVVVDGAPAWERAVVWLCYPVWRRLMERALDAKPQALETALNQISEAFDIVEATLAGQGTRFLGGDQPGSLDIIFSALVAPLMCPERYGSPLPARESQPPALRAIVDPLRARRAGQLALETYDEARPSPQPRLRRPRRNRTILQRVLGPRVQRLGSRVAVMISRPVVFRKLAIVARWPDVQSVLALDLDFHVAPVNGPPFDVISGPFVLGLDRNVQFAHERSRMYGAVSRINGDDVRNGVAGEATRLLDDAVARHGRIDVAHGYAHLVAARTARYVFGVPGPTEADLLRVCRALFHYSFLNQSNEESVAERARRAAAEMRGWVSDEIGRRRREHLDIDDVLGRLMAAASRDDAPLDDDAVRRNLTGLLVGAIDTTSTTVPRIVYVLASDPALLARVERDVDDRARMLGWCSEALRSWPSAPLLFRRAPHGAVIGGRAIPPDSLIGAFTQAAMHDPSVFPQPMDLDPTRPPAHYINFGGGLHPCAGRGVNNVQLPELVALLVSRGIAHVGQPRFVGPFIDELVVTFRRPQP